MNDTEAIVLFVRVKGEPFRTTFNPAAVPSAVHVTVPTTLVYKVPQEKRVRVRERDPPARQLAPAFNRTI